MTSGTTVASEPVDLPTIIFVTGISMMMPMMKGRERPTLMIHPRMRLNHLWGQMPWGWLMLSSTPRGRPMR